MSAPRLSEKTKRAILAAYMAGEKGTVVAARFGVHPTYPSLLWRRRVPGADRDLRRPGRSASA